MIGCEIDGYNEFSSERYPKARKAYRCDECGRDGLILPGEPYVYIAGKCEGEFWTVRQSLEAYHLCRAINAHVGECAVPLEGLREVEPCDLHGIRLHPSEKLYIWRCCRELITGFDGFGYWQGIADDNDGGEYPEGLTKQEVEELKLPASRSDWAAVYIDSLNYARERNSCAPPPKILSQAVLNS